MDSLRGKHSTGIAVIDDYNNVDIEKAACTPFDFLDLKRVSKLLDRAINRVVIGHNRYATQGAINGINAHPFQHGDITGVHNGTLRNQKKLPDSEYFEVDSENIIHAINEEGIEETNKKLVGAYALVWWNEATERLHVIRNSERPLYYTYTEDNKTVFWASEPFMLRAALHRNDIKHQDVHLFETHTLYTFDPQLDKRIAPVMSKPSVKKLEAYVAPVYHHQGSHTKKQGKKQGRKGNVTEISCPPYLKQLGYTLDSEVEFHLLATKGKMAIGETLDANSCEVRIHLGTPTLAEKLLDTGNFYLAKGISGFRKPTKGKENGYISVKAANLQERDWSTFTPAATSEDSFPLKQEFVLDHRNNIVTRSEFKTRYNAGCCICANPFDFDMRDFTLTTVDTGHCDGCKDLPLLLDHLH